MPGNTSFFSFFVVVVCSCTVNFIAWYLINRLLIWMFENILLEWRQILPRRWKLKPFQTWQRLSRKLRSICQQTISARASCYWVKNTIFHGIPDACPADGWGLNLFKNMVKFWRNIISHKHWKRMLKSKKLYFMHTYKMWSNMSFWHIWRSVGWPLFQPIHQSRVINIVLGTAVDKRWKIKSYPTVAFLILTFCGFTAISVFPSEFVNSIAMINSFNWKCIIVLGENYKKM